MERSVQLIVAGGLTLVAGLWVFAAAGRIGQWDSGGVAVPLDGEVMALVGAAAALVGVVVLGAGIARDLTYGPFGDR